MPSYAEMPPMTHGVVGLTCLGLSLASFALQPSDEQKRNYALPTCLLLLAPFYST